MKLMIPLFAVCLLAAPLAAQSTATVKTTERTSPAKPTSAKAKSKKPVKAKKAAKPAPAQDRTMRGKKYSVTSIAIDYGGTPASTAAAKAE